ncbi:hypothetical protein B5E58_10970 [Tyzzerella sp. An114]|uniref:helix-turn-helix domain-containing protein n=1 Tax=Tyzzerella sp. An114 TaxID=1965545 RepID=UPI000B441632|nr:helix-turn-helix transcriptional regulator [Tyzzerella sp. An114]OUQ56361.1 hypothetical protein B5E58_10970 [Tyzzerella sp. An114]
MFYNRLKKICELKDTNPTQLLKDINVSTGSLGNWKKGILPKGDILIKISTHLDVSIDYLLLGKEECNLKEPEISQKNEDSLKTDEKLLIKTYREVSDEGKDLIQESIRDIWADHRIKKSSKKSNSKHKDVAI